MISITQPPRYGTAPIAVVTKSIAPSGSQCGCTSCQAFMMKSHARNSSGNGTVVAIGGIGGAGTDGTDGGVTKIAASSGNDAAATGSAEPLRIIVCASTRPSRTHWVRPGRSIGPYSAPSGPTTKY